MPLPSREGMRDLRCGLNHCRGHKMPNDKPEKKIIKTNHAPAPVGPYSQAVAHGNLLFCSGQIAIDPQTNQVIKGSVSEQSQLVMKNIKAVLEEAGTSFEKVIKTTIFLKNM